MLFLFTRLEKRWKFRKKARLEFFFIPFLEFSDGFAKGREERKVLLYPIEKTKTKGKGKKEGRNEREEGGKNVGGDYQISEFLAGIPLLRTFIGDTFSERNVCERGKHSRLHWGS